MQTLKSPAAVSEAALQGLDKTTGELYVIDTHNDNAGVIEGKAWPLIPSGIYQAVFMHHETAVAFNVPRVYLHMKLVTPGEHYGQVLYRAYRVKSTSGRNRKGAAFKVSLRSDYVREMAILLNLQRLDRISPLALKNKIIRVRVDEVIKDHKQREMPKALRYSVIRELLSVEAGS